jgi:hypothetical protein
MSEGFISRGFGGRRRMHDERLPLGQYLVDGFPILSAGPTPHTPLEEWDFSIVGEVDEPKRWTWEEFRQLPSEEITKDIHCETKWSKLDTMWEGVSVDTLLEGVELLGVLGLPQLRRPLARAALLGGLESVGDNSSDPLEVRGMDDKLRLDGNAAAGSLTEIISFAVTTEQ